MKNLVQFIKENNENDFFDSIYNELDKALSTKRYFKDVLKTIKLYYDNKSVGKHITSKNISSLNLDNKFDIIFGFNEKKETVIVALYDSKYKSINGVFYDMRNDEEENLGSITMLTDWSSLINRYDKYKMKYFITSPNKKLRKKFIGGTADLEKY